MPDPSPPAGTPTPRTTGGSKRWQPPAPAELQGLLPDDYTVEKLLGRGGMGAVYQGRRLSLDRPVAIKILSTDLEDSDTRYVERFKNEARAMAQLSHPGIVAVYGFGETADGLLYIVMEFIEGTDVHRMIKEQSRLRTEHAMAITAHVCDALAFAHERGIIHRDIKPANIMVGYDGMVKVADFGLAKMTVDGATLGLTKSGMAMGTLHYMAPEALILGTAADHRADIYAVGVMLYQMLTGKLPQGVVDPPSEQVPGLDPRYDAIIAKAMSEDRDERYQNVRELRSDLDKTLTKPVVKVAAEAAPAPAALTTTARPQRPEGQNHLPTLKKFAILLSEYRSPLLMGSLTGFLAFILLVAAYFWQHQEPTPASPKPTEIVEKTSSENIPTTAADTPQATLSKPPQPSAIQATKEQPFVNSLGMKFIPVPGTNVWLCIHETRRQDYAAYAAAVSGVGSSWKSQTFGSIPCGREDSHPVVGVSWEDAQAFCSWLSKKEGKTYRLPTDEEWSLAAGLKEQRGPSTTPRRLNREETNAFPWGGGYPPQTADRAGNYADTSYCEKISQYDFIADYADGFPTTAPVMSFKPNQLGLYDLGGNVWEWCADWYDNAQKYRVLRGASFLNYDRGNLLSSRRDYFGAPGYHYDYGFRCVLEPSPGAPVINSLDTKSSGLGADAQLPPPPGGMVCIPGGSFKMGDNLDGMSDAPVHQVTLDTFFIDRHEVFQEQWQSVYDWGVKHGYQIRSGSAKAARHPVHSITWYDAVKWCNARSEKEGLIPCYYTDTAQNVIYRSGSSDVTNTMVKWTANGYRLPTEAEWEKAARGGLTGKRYPWGDSVTDSQANYYRSDDEFESASPLTTPVGYYNGSQRPAGVDMANGYGLYDMAGNVEEWCWDWYSAPAAGGTNPHGPMTGTARVQRGGSAGYGSSVLRCADRTQSWPYTVGTTLGFRCVLMTIANTTAAASVVPPPTPSVPKPEPVTTSTNAKADAPFTNSLGMNFVPVPGTDNLMCIHETRKQDYAAFATENPTVDGSWLNPKTTSGVAVSFEGNHPVVNVNWGDANAFCVWLSKKEGRGYRLPTDLEWSFAVGIGAAEPLADTPAGLNQKIKNVYPWGEVWPPPNRAGNYADIMALAKFPTHGVIDGYTDGYGTTAPVMSFPANPLGIYDLGGNVLEWCQDSYNTTNETRVMRGGAWLGYGNNFLLSSCRYPFAPDKRHHEFGFRCVLEPSPGSTAALPVKPEVMKPGLSSSQLLDEGMLRNQIRQLLSSPWTVKKRRDLLQGEAANRFDILLSEIALGSASTELLTRHMLVEIITQRADERSKADILRAFEHYHALFPVIVQKNWVREAGPATAKALQHYPQANVPADEGATFIAFCFQSEEDAVWAELERLFGNPKFSAVYPLALKGLSTGMRKHQERRLERIVEAMWGATGKIDLSNLSGRIIDTAAAAARIGKLAALEVLGMFLTNGSPQINGFQQGILQKVAADPVVELTDCPATLPPIEKGRWIIEHLPSLQWDRQKKRFVTGN